MPTEDEANSQFRRRNSQNKNERLDAEANIRVRVRVKDLVELMQQLDYAKEVIFPGTETKIGISGIKKTNAKGPRLIKSEVSFRGKTNDRASFVLESLVARFLK